jgi:FkbM family methyltransferase
MFNRSAIVYAIEPTYELVSKHLYPKFQYNERVKICQWAIDVQNGFKKFNVASKMEGAADWGCSSLYEFSDDIHEKWPGRPDFEVTHSYTVPTMTLYDFCELYKIKEIDYLWIDTQGNDFNVLLSLGDKIDIVKEGRCEVAENVELYKNTNNKRSDVEDWLKSKNFNVQLNYGLYESDLIFTI